MSIVLVCVWHNCPDDADLSCENPWAGDTELNSLFKYTGAPSAWCKIDQLTQLAPDS